MTPYKIITDSGCDLPERMLRELDVAKASLSVLFRGESRPDSVDEGITDLYNALRAGEISTTSAVNPDGWANVMEPALAAGQDALVLAFSSGLSTTYQSAVIAANELMEKYPERKVYVVDTLCASLGEGLLVWYACRKRDEGLELEALRDWVEENKLHLCHWFTVDDLMFLKRGGRVSAATALVGTMLQIKPVLHVDNEGHLINVSKARGRKASIEALAAKVAKCCCVDMQRKEHMPMVREGDEGPVQMPSLAPSPHEELEQKEGMEALDEAIGQLKPRERQLFEMRQQEGLSTEEIARQTGILRALVQSMVAMARKKVFNEMKRRMNR